MDGQVVSALAAIMGATVGGLGSFASTWIGDKSRHRRDLLQREIVKRETVYSDFIEKASKLYVESATHNVDQNEAEGAIMLYAIASRIRLFASEQVIKEAESVLDQIILQYGAANMSPEQLREIAIEKKSDFLKAFSIICRHELADLQRGI
jgi:5'(3')-deoxyribonucleotidase